jgi:HTH-type transcriptional regulator/antitoxin HipB
MLIRTPTDLGALIRDRRAKLGLEQRALAEKVGVSRQWIVEVEKGKPRAEIGLLLRTIDALGIVLAAENKAPGSFAAVIAVTGRNRNTAGNEATGKKRGGASPINIDAIIAAARGERK